MDPFLNCENRTSDLFPKNSEQEKKKRESLQRSDVADIILNK